MDFTFSPFEVYDCFTHEAGPQAMAELDRDGGGTIDEQEFLAWSTYTWATILQQRGRSPRGSYNRIDGPLPVGVQRPGAKTRGASRKAVPVDKNAKSWTPGHLGGLCEVTDRRSSITSITSVSLHGTSTCIPEQPDGP